MVPNLLNSFIKFPSAAAAAVGGWVELGRTTLGGLASNVTVSGLPDKRYYMILRSTLPTGQIDIDMRFNSDSGSNYARRFNSGGIDSTGTSTNFICSYNQGGASVPLFCVEYVSNLTAQEKLVNGHLINQSTAGAGTAPGRAMEVGKWANTSDSIDEVEMNESRGGQYNTGTEIVVLGWDPADVHTNNFWEELASVDLSGGAAQTISTGTFTPKKYLWIQAYLIFGSTSAGAKIQVGNTTIDTGSNYAGRRSSNGGSDGTDTSTTGIDFVIANMNASGEAGFLNTFIVNNASNEKLAISHWMETSPGTGAGNFPNRRESVWKWTNTSDLIDIIKIGGGSASAYGTKTILKVWGSN